jgi:hypothetical protein
MKAYRRVGSESACRRPATAVGTEAVNPVTAPGRNGNHAEAEWEAPDMGIEK